MAQGITILPATDPHRFLREGLMRMVGGWNQQAQQGQQLRNQQMMQGQQLQNQMALWQMQNPMAQQMGQARLGLMGAQQGLAEAQTGYYGRMPARQQTGGLTPYQIMSQRSAIQGRMNEVRRMVFNKEMPVKFARTEINRLRREDARLAALLSGGQPQNPLTQLLSRLAGGGQRPLGLPAPKETKEAGFGALPGFLQFIPKDKWPDWAKTQLETWTKPKPAKTAEEIAMDKVRKDKADTDLAAAKERLTQLRNPQTKSWKTAQQYLTAASKAAQAVDFDKVNGYMAKAEKWIAKAEREESQTVPPPKGRPNDRANIRNWLFSQ